MPLEQEGSKSVVRAWLKKVGDAVTRDEPLVELETDKVAVEVPSPADGVLAEIALNEGDEARAGGGAGCADAREPSTPDAPASSRHGCDVASGKQRRRLEAGGPRAMRLSPLVKRLLAEHKLDAERHPRHRPRRPHHAQGRGGVLWTAASAAAQRGA